MSGRLRWTFAADFPAAKVPPRYVRVSYDLGKKTFTTKFWYNADSKSEEEEMKPVWDILASLYEFMPDSKTSIKPEAMGDITVVTYSITPFISSPKLEVIQEIKFYECWASSINFGDLDYSSNSEIEIEIAWKFDTYALTIPNEEKTK